MPSGHDAGTGQESPAQPAWRPNSNRHALSPLSRACPIERPLAAEVPRCCGSASPAPISPLASATASAGLLPEEERDQGGELIMDTPPDGPSDRRREVASRATGRWNRDRALLPLSTDSVGILQPGGAIPRQGMRPPSPAGAGGDGQGISWCRRGPHSALRVDLFQVIARFGVRLTSPAHTFPGSRPASGRIPGRGCDSARSLPCGRGAWARWRRRTGARRGRRGPANRRCRGR